MKKLILLFILINITKNSISQKNNPYNKTNDQLNNMSKSYLRMIGEDDNIDAQHPINASDPNHKEYIENVFNGKKSNSAVDPSNDIDWFQKGYDAGEAKEYENAIIYYNKAIQLKPDYADAYYNRGNAKYDLKDYTGAIADYNKAIQLNPDDAKAYNNRGGAKNNLKDYTGAIADYNKAIQLKPDYAKYYFNRGGAKYYLKDKYGACADYSKAGELGDSDAYETIQKNCQ